MRYGTAKTERKKLLDELPSVDRDKNPSKTLKLGWHGKKLGSYSEGIFVSAAPKPIKTEFNNCREQKLDYELITHEQSLEKKDEKYLTTGTVKIEYLHYIDRNPRTYCNKRR